VRLADAGDARKFSRNSCRIESRFSFIEMSHHPRSGRRPEHAAGRQVRAPQRGDGAPRRAAQ